MKKLFIAIAMATAVCAEAQVKTANTNTGTAEKAKPAENMMQKKKVDTGFPKLVPTTGSTAQMRDTLGFEEAVAQLSKKITTEKRRRKPVEELEKELSEAEKGLLFLKGTDRVVIVDSMVVDKNRFLAAYEFSDEVGSIKVTDNGETTEFETELGNKKYMTVKEKTDSTNFIKLASAYKDGDKFSSPKLLKGLDMDCDMNYPFMMPDGITFYFAARNEEGLGNYDLYVTRYDSEGDRFYTPENIGFPYNSYANDYMLVIDENNNLGWFASDRYQPEGKVCIYTFIPNSVRTPYDYENESHDLIKHAASLVPIKSTWTEDNKNDRIKAKQKLAQLKYENSMSGKNKLQAEFYLVINDLHTYTRYEQFKSAEAQTKCREWVLMKKNLEILKQQLDELREKYSKSNKQTRNAMKQQILDMENRFDEMVKEVQKAEVSTRNIEIQAL